MFSSHVHDDHCHPETLARLRERIGRVLLPDDRPRLRARYEGLGFRDIVLLENGRTLRLTDDLAVTCLWSDPVLCQYWSAPSATVPGGTDGTPLGDSLAAGSGRP